MAVRAYHAATFPLFHQSYRTGSAAAFRSLPGRFLYARNLALVSQLTEANSANTELTKVSMGSAANLTSVVFAAGILLLSLLLYNHRLFRHDSSSSLFGSYFINGAPIRVRSSLASSSVCAVVTKIISIPRILSILS